MQAKQVHQKPHDVNVGLSTFIKADHVTMEGNNKSFPGEKGSLFIDTRKTLKTKDTFQCENLNMSLITEKAKLSGHINDGNLQVKASKDVILKSGFDSHVKTSNSGKIY